MNNLAFIYTPLLLLTMAACSESALDRLEPDCPIQLGAIVRDLPLDSRAEAVPFLPQSGNPLTAAVWLRSEEHPGYGDTPGSNGLPVRTTVTFNGSQLEYVRNDNGENIQYPIDRSNVYCIGLYPDEGWSAPADGAGTVTTVTHAINGEEDLMFADEMKGSWDSHFGTQTYRHLLAWIKINICATSHDAVDAWGRIEQITITSDSEVTIDVESGTCTYGGEEKGIETIAPGEGVTLSTAIQEVGSVFCSPETSYTVTVTYMNRSGVRVERRQPLQLNTISDDDSMTAVTDESEARGRCFVFSLYFTPADVIEGVCMLNAWNSQNEDIYITDESTMPGESGDSDNNNPDQNEENDETVS